MGSAVILDLINKQGITRARVIVQSEVSYLKSIGEIDEAKDMAAMWKKAIRQLARPLPFAYHARLFDWVDKACMAIALRYHADVKLVRKNLIQSLKL